VVSSLLILASLQNLPNDFEVYFPPLFDLSILIFLSERFSTKALNSLKFPRTSSRLQEINPIFMRVIINK
jgi:hypothetical protein